MTTPAERDSLDRRTFSRSLWTLSTSALAASGLSVHALATRAQAATAAAAVEILETKVISGFSSDYHGWPTLARRSSGELMVVYSGGRQAHVCPFGRVEMIQSQDNGQSWTFPRVILDGPIDDRDAGICETAAGSLLVTTFTSLAYEPSLAKLTGAQRAAWQAVHERLSDAERKEHLGVWMLRSTDGGVSWSNAYRTPVGSPHGPAVVSDGRLLYAGVDLWGTDRKVGVAESRDDGQSWNWLADIPTRPGDNSQGYHELHLVESHSGKLVVHIRNHNPPDAGTTLQSESTDGGRSWSVPHSIGVWGLPSHLVRMRDGGLLMSYGYRRQPFGNQVRLSYDEGLAWSDPLSLSSDGIGGDLGYPSTVELDDGEFYSVWYERLADNPHAVLRGCHWRLKA